MSPKVMKADKVQVTKKFIRKAKKIIKDNKQIKQDLKDTINDLRNGTNADLDKYKEGHNWKGVPRKMKKYIDVHFTNADYDLVILYQYEKNGELRILDLQSVTDHNHMNNEVPTDRYVPYNESDIFGSSMHPLTRRQQELIDVYYDLSDASERDETDDYEEGYLDAMYDLIHNFGLEKYFE